MVKTANVTPPKPPRVWRDALPAVVIFLLVLIAYFPALRGEFIWDDDYNILKSAPLRSLDGLRRIWFEPGATQQYYPLTHTSFWLDYHLWGLHPWPYHLENLLLHALGAVLLWRLLARLGAHGPWLGAALFALHPVGVESVAWITERKNTLSGVFCVASALMAVEFWLPRMMGKNVRDAKDAKVSFVTFGPSRFYWLALVFYLCALGSKTATIGLPGVILLLVWWKRGRWVMRDFVLLLPFLACGLGMALITIAIENHLMLVGGASEDWKFSPLERLLIGSRAVWFYLGKIFWPHPLMFMYPRWNIQVSQPLAYVPLIAIIGGFIVLWRKRNGWARPVLVALGSFVCILFPVLGAFNVFFFRYSFVCDHFQYLAAIGPIALEAAAIATALGVFAKGQPLLKPVICGILLLMFGVLTWRQTGVFQNRETLWRDTLVHNRDSWMAHDNLGIYLSQSGRFEEADIHYQTAIQLKPNDHIAYYDLGLESAIKGDLDEAVNNFTRALEICPSYALAHYDLANALTRQGKLDDAIREYSAALQTYPDLTLGHFNLGNALLKKGKLDEAIQEFTKTAQLEPDFALAPLSLGNALAKKGNLDGAIEQYHRALELQPTNASIHASLGRVLAAEKKVDEAMAHFRKALEIDPNSVDALANLGNALLGQGRLDEAVASYRSALRLNPNSAIIHYDLGVALSRQGKTTEAQTELDQAKQLNGEMKR